MNPLALPRPGLRAPIFAPSLLLIAFVTAFAQSGRTPAPPKEPPIGTRSSTMRVELPTPIAETPVPLIGSRTGFQPLSFTTPETNFESVLIEGAAFSADSVTEHVQTLGDGNRIGQKFVTHMYRDGAGRTRRDHEMPRGNAMAPDGQPPRFIIINDPIGRVNYAIDTQSGTAQKRELPPARVMEAMQRTMRGNAPFSVLMPTSTAHRRMAEGDVAQPLPKPVTEKLLQQTIEGVLAEGTRVTMTIPAGEFDNEQPMIITHEEWYAPELHMLVLMRHNDPRFGETTFRLTNILRGEPAAELFQAPTNYKIVDRRNGDDGMFPARDRPPVLRKP
jgi:hypothetical protein